MTALAPINADERVVARGRILSVNVGRPISSEWRRATVTTAIRKLPVAGRVTVRGVNLVGDAQADLAVHGGPRKAVYAYPSEHYEWWAAEFGLDRTGWGFVGENLTIAGIREEDVAFGDIFCAGTMRLLITEPRGPCYKLGMRVGADDAPVRMLRDGRTGFYLGVLQEGEVAADDEVVCHDGQVSPRVSMAELCGAFAAPAAIDDDRLDQLIELPGLDGEWRAHFEHERDRRQRPTQAPTCRELVVSDVGRAAHDVVVIEFEAGDLGYESGQFLPLIVPIDGSEHVRCYSLLDPPQEKRLRIAVRRSREESGRPSVSRWLHASVRPGLTLDVREPAGTFTLASTSQERPVALIAGGIGITPMLALAKTLASDSRRFALFFGVRDSSDLLFEDELRQLAKTPSCTEIHVFYPDAHEVGDGLRRTDAPIVPLGAIAAAVPADSDFYVCGPTSMQEAIDHGLRAWGVAEDRIRLEFFGDAPLLAVDAAVQEVVFDRCSRVVLWSDPATTLLDLASEHGIEIPYACRSGSCGTCAVRVLAGSVGYLRGPAAPIAPDTCLTCIAYPLEATVLDA